MLNKITVVVPTFNSEKTLEKCIESILNQTVVPTIIIVDGGSSDSTASIVDRYREHIAVYISEPDRGVFDAWNKGLLHVKTDWTVFLGSDDYYYDCNSVENLIKAIGVVKDDVGILYPHIYKSDANGIFDSNDNKDVESISARPLYNMPFTHCGSAHRMSVFKVIGLFDSTYRIAGDFEFLNRMKRDYGISYVQDYKVCIGVEGLSMSRNSRIKLIKELINIYRTYNLFGFNVQTVYLLAKLSIHKLIGFIGK